MLEKLFSKRKDKIGLMGSPGPSVGASTFKDLVSHHQHNLSLKQATAAGKLEIQGDHAMRTMITSLPP